MKDVRVLCLTYGKLKGLVDRATDRLVHEGIHIATVDGLSEEMETEISQSISQGVDVIVAGGSNAAVARRRFDLPVVVLRTSAYDYVQAIGRAKKFGGKIAVVVLEDSIKIDLQSVGDLLGAELEVVIYCTGDNLEKAILSSDAQVVVGAGHAVEVAERMGLPNVLIYPGEETVVEAILEAQKLVKAMRRERERNELTGALIRCTPNSIVIINEQGKIIEFNHEAEKAYGKAAQSVKGQSVEEMLRGCTLGQLLHADCDPDSTIREVGERTYLQKQTRITQGKLVTGAIEILAEMSDIRHAEYRYSVEQERKNQLKGFVAKTHFRDILGSSKELKTTIDEARLFSKTDASILLFGETGTGKELFAQSIHNQSERRKGPFIAINCAALPESLLESELFGYEEGAFTGSKKGGKMGIFELANGGTIFLDEIGEIGLALQARLLRALQEKEVMRIGSERIYKFDVRVLSATNKDIIHATDKEFRRDLLYRLKVLELRLPPLRRREGDVAELFLSFFRQRTGLAEYGLELPGEVLGLLNRYSWPGNVRELQNVCERFCIYLSQTGRPAPRLLKHYMVRAMGEEQLLTDIMARHDYTPGQKVEHSADLLALVQELKECFDYNNEQAATALGISRTTLWRLKK